MNKKFPLIALCAALCILPSCQKEMPDVEKKAVINITFAPEGSASQITKAQGADHAVDDYDKQVRTLQLYAFNSNGKLDAYELKSGTPLELKSGSTYVSFDITVSTGQKYLYVVANSHNIEAFAAIKSKSELEALVSDLKRENVKDFCMVGNTSATVNGDMTLNIPIRRLISRIDLMSVKAAFRGGYSGMSLTDVSAYLINVTPHAVIGTSAGSGTKINANAYVAADCTGFEMENMLHASLPDLSATPTAAANYFYCYANNDASAKTMLVVEGVLDGSRVYYPIIIADDPSSATYSLSANNTYIINSLVITRPGSDNPYTPVEKGSVSITIQVLDWTSRQINTITI